MTPKGLKWSKKALHIKNSIVGFLQQISVGDYKACDQVFSNIQEGHMTNRAKIRDQGHNQVEFVELGCSRLNYVNKLKIIYFLWGPAKFEEIQALKIYVRLAWAQSIFIIKLKDKFFSKSR